MIEQKLNERTRPQTSITNRGELFGRKSNLAQKINEFKSIAENIKRDRNRSERERRVAFKNRKDEVEVRITLKLVFIRKYRK